MVDLEASPGNIQISQTVAGLAAGEQLLVSFEIGEANFGNAKLDVLWDGSRRHLRSAQRPDADRIVAVTAQRHGNDTLTFQEIGQSGDNTGTYLTDVSAQQVAGSVIEGGLNEPSPSRSRFRTAFSNNPDIVGNDSGRCDHRVGHAGRPGAFRRRRPRHERRRRNGFQLVAAEQTPTSRVPAGAASDVARQRGRSATLSGNTLTATALTGTTCSR